MGWMEKKNNSENTSAVLTPDVNGIIYVTPNGAGNQTGDSWANATNDIQLGMYALNVKQVWVAAGTYKPKYRADNMSNANPDDRNNAFNLIEGVKIYGSFAGNENNLSERNAIVMTNNPTILSGDLGIQNDSTDNAYHIITTINCTNATVLDGFVIELGNADGDDYITVSSKSIFRNDGGGIMNHSSSPIFNNLILRNNYGYNGGAVNNFSSSPIFTNVVFNANSASNGGAIWNSNSSKPILNNSALINNRAKVGAGIRNQGSSPILNNVTVVGNKASFQGGAFYNDNSSVILTNVALLNNTAYIGGGFFNNYSSLTLTNVTISANAASEGGAIYINYGSQKINLRNSIVYGNSSGIEMYDDISGLPDILNASYSLVQGMNSTDNGNLAETDPKFVDASSGDYRLTDVSPVINKGNNTYFDAGQTPDLHLITTDLDGNPRIYGQNIDLGAYENQTNTVPVTLLSFTAKAEKNTAKLEWKTSSETNNRAFLISHSVDGKTFTEIGKVASASTSSTLKDYVFYDNNPVQGINYYRLQQVDFDGKITDHGSEKS